MPPKSIKKRLLESTNERKDIHGYADIWSKALPCSFSHLASMKSINLNVTDVANMIYNTDYANLKSFRALVVSKSETLIFIPSYGIWKEQKGDEEMRNIIKRFMVILEREVIDRIQMFLDEIYKIPPKDRTDDQKGDMEFMEQRRALFKTLYKLLSDTKQDSIIKHLIHRIVMETKYYDDFDPTTFNNAEGYIAFDDGVLNVATKQLIPEKEALELYFTQTVGYNYADVEEVGQDVVDACCTPSLLPCQPRVVCCDCMSL